MLISVILAGCTTITTAEREKVISTGNIEQIVLVEKDFIVVGMIFLTSSATIDANGSIIEVHQ